MNKSIRIPVDIRKPYLGTVSVEEMNRLLGNDKSESYDVTFNVGGFAFDLTVGAKSPASAVRKAVRTANANLADLAEVTLSGPFHTFGRVTVKKITAAMAVEVYRKKTGEFFRGKLS